MIFEYSTVIPRKHTNYFVTRLVLKHGWPSTGHAQRKIEGHKTRGRGGNIGGLSIDKNWNLFPMLPIQPPDMLKGRWAANRMALFSLSNLLESMYF